jgi:hypothetical protein
MPNSSRLFFERRHVWAGMPHMPPTFSVIVFTADIAAISTTCKQK